MELEFKEIIDTHNDKSIIKYLSKLNNFDFLEKKYNYHKSNKIFTTNNIFYLIHINKIKILEYIIKHIQLNFNILDNFNNNYLLKFLINNWTLLITYCFKYQKTINLNICNINQQHILDFMIIKYPILLTKYLKHNDINIYYNIHNEFIITKLFKLEDLTQNYKKLIRKIFTKYKDNLSLLLYNIDIFSNNIFQYILVNNNILFHKYFWFLKTLLQKCKIEFNWNSDNIYYHHLLDTFIIEKIQHQKIFEYITLKCYTNNIDLQLNNTLFHIIKSKQLSYLDYFIQHNIEYDSNNIDIQGNTIYHILSCFDIYGSIYFDVFNHNQHQIIQTNRLGFTPIDYAIFTNNYNFIIRLFNTNILKFIDLTNYFKLFNQEKYIVSDIKILFLKHRNEYDTLENTNDSCIISLEEFDKNDYIDICQKCNVKIKSNYLYDWLIHKEECPHCRHKWIYNQIQYIIN
jgi:hypothetical protein